MKKLITLLALLIVTLTSFATNYYISNLGNDNAVTNSISTPWATLAKVNSSMGIFVAGDSILFERGDEFFGTLNITKAGIIIGAYGTGNLPIITGFRTLTGWTNVGTNLWRANVPTPKNTLKVLTINGQLVRMGRYPNYNDRLDDWIRYNAVLNPVSPIVVPSSQAIPTNLVGGELVLFKHNWNLDIMPIQSISGNNITCINPSGLYGIADGPGGNRGFFVQNNINTLDVNTEWYFDPTTKAITMFSNTGAPSGIIKVAVFDTLINVGSTSNITIENLDIQGSNFVGILTSGVGYGPSGTFSGPAGSSGSNLTIKNNIVRYISYWGITARANNSQILNNTVRDVGSNGIWITNNGTITGNTVKAISAIEGMGGSQNDQGLGIVLQNREQVGTTITCSRNIVDSIGYNGIKFDGDNILVRENIVQHTCITKSDGGAIYTYDQGYTQGCPTCFYKNTNRRIVKNIVVNVGKILYGVDYPGLATQAYGIYLDGSANNILVDSNVIGPNIYNENATCSPTNTTDDGAIMMNGAINATVRGNIVFKWPDAMEMWNYAPSVPPTGNRFVGNALYINNVGNSGDACTWNQSFQYHELASSTQAVVQAQVQAMGFMDSNYVNDNAISPFIAKNQAGGSGALKLAAWRTYSGKDANTQSFPNTTPDFQYNTSQYNKVHYFKGFRKTDYRGIVYNNYAIIPPYYGNIFFPSGSSTSSSITYYVSNTGDDNNDGLSPSTAWATIDKVNSSMALFGAGDSVLFQCGGTFFGTLTVTTSGIILGSYGTGNKPEITGFYTIPSSAWTSPDVNLWRADIPMTGNDFSTINYSNRQSRVYRSNSLTIDGRLIQKGRYPNIAAANEGWLTYTSLPAGNPSTLTSASALPALFNGGDVVVRKVPWVIDVLPITGQSGNNLTINNVTTSYSNGLAGGLGYFIQNHLLTLDVNNEWFFDNTDKRLTIYNTTSPSSRVVRIPIIDIVVNLGATNSVTIDNLDIKGAGNYGVVGSGNNITVKNSIVRNISYWGVYLSGSNAIINNCLVRDIASNGIWVNGSNSLVSNSQIRNCGSIAGYGGSSDYEYEGIHIANSGTIRNNVIDTTGYHGIHFDASSNITIRENVVRNAVFHKSDGGAIYCWDANGTRIGSNRQIKRNIVANIGRLLSGVPDGDSRTAFYGIYMDGGTNNVVVDSNIVAFSNVSQNSNNTTLVYETDFGILFNNPVRNTLTNNVIFGWPCSFSVNDWYGIVTDPPTPLSAKPNNNNFQNNGLYVNSIIGGNWRQTNRSFDYRTQIGQSLLQTEIDIQNMGVMNNNFIANVQSPFHWTNNANDGPFTATLPTWRSATGKDLNSTLIPTTTPMYVVNYGTTGGDTTVFFSGLSKIDYKGIVYNNQATIPAFYGTILFDNGTVPSAPLSITSTDTTQINCFGNTTTLTVNATGGSVPYTYRLNTGSYQASNSFTGVSAGTYTVTVRDNTLATASVSRTIYEPTPLITDLPTSGSITTIGGTTTITQPVASGGSPNYVYNINGGTYQASNIFINRPAGTYTINVRDIRGCVTTKSITIVQPNAPLIISRPLIQN